MYLTIGIRMDMTLEVLEHFMVRSDFIAVHQSTSADASLSHHLCA